ncbi:MAG: hypothetical protein WDN06_15645 [Asticcacaulis sp.]
MTRACAFAVTKTDSDVRFWALFAVVMALLTQAVFPPQVMAATGDHGTQFVLCTAGVDSAPIVDKTAAKLFKAYHKGLGGLKCASCVIASVTAITTPPAQFQRVVYAAGHADFRPAALTTPVRARAPPRPHSCGPPSLANA